MEITSGFILIYLTGDGGKNLLASIPFYDDVQVISFWLEFKASIKPTHYLMEYRDQTNNIVMEKSLSNKDAFDAVSKIHNMIIHTL